MLMMVTLLLFYCSDSIVMPKLAACASVSSYVYSFEALCASMLNSFCFLFLAESEFLLQWHLDGMLHQCLKSLDHQSLLMRATYALVTPVNTKPRSKGDGCPRSQCSATAC